MKMINYFPKAHIDPMLTHGDAILLKIFFVLKTPWFTRGTLIQSVTYIMQRLNKMDAEKFFFHSLYPKCIPDVRIRKLVCARGVTLLKRERRRRTWIISSMMLSMICCSFLIAVDTWDGSLPKLEWFFTRRKKICDRGRKSGKKLTK